MRKWQHLVIHCSDSGFGCAELINEWHVQERGWKKIGYHYVINNGRQHPSSPYDAEVDGLIETGRTLDEIGAHCRGFNEFGIGICLIGVDSFTSRQMSALKTLVTELTEEFKIPVLNIIGHCDSEDGKRQGKTCPNFDVLEWRKGLLPDPISAPNQESKI